MNKISMNFLDGLDILRKYTIINIEFVPINQVAPFSGEPEWAHSAYCCVTIDWYSDDAQWVTDEHKKILRSIGWRIEGGMGEDYYTYRS